MTSEHPLLEATKPIERDYHPIPQEFSDPDQLVAPLVIPASLSSARFDQANPVQVTFLDVRGRMRSELVRVVGFDFASLLELRSNSPASQSTANARAASSSSQTVESRQSQELALRLLQEAYVATECVMNLAVTMVQQETTPQPVACPTDLIWCCAYTPTGVKNAYWMVEGILCHYNLFVLSLQAAFLQLHTNRCSKFLMKKDDAHARRELFKHSYIRACRRHLDHLIKQRESGSHAIQQAYIALTALGMLPDETTLKSYTDVLDLMQLDYTIFHILLPIFRDNGAALNQALSCVAIPHEVVTEEKITVAKLAANKYLCKLIATTKFATQKANSVYKNVFTRMEYVDEANVRDYYRETMILKHLHLAQLVKYLAQAPYVYKALYRILVFNLTVRDDQHLQSARDAIENLKGFTNDPCFQLFLYNGNERHPSVLVRNQMTGIQKLRYNTVGLRPRPRDLARGLIADAELLRKNVAVPTEIHNVDLLFDVWSTKMVGQYPPGLLDIIVLIMSKLDTFIVSEKLLEKNSALESPPLTDKRINMEYGIIKFKHESKEYKPSKVSKAFIQQIMEEYRLYREALDRATAAAGTEGESKV